MTETSSSVTWQWKERLQRGFRRFGGLLAIVTLLIKAMISQVDVHVKTYSVKHFKYVHFIVCQLYLYIVVQLLSCVGLFMTPWTAARQASLSFTVSQSLLKFMSTELVVLSNHLIFCCPLLLLSSIFPSLRVFSNESALCNKWPKYWSFSFNISPFSEYSGLISFPTDWFDLLAVQGIL